MNALGDAAQSGSENQPADPGYNRGDVRSGEGPGLADAVKGKVENAIDTVKERIHEYHEQEEPDHV